jgi:hypothetical protein
MKTKIIIREGVQSLVVDDKEINNASKYGSPILLAVITNYFNSQCWSFEDYRLKQHLIPSAYLNDSNEHIYDFNNYPEEDKKLVLSKLKHYKLSEEEGLFYWRNDGVDLNGDIPKDDKRRIFTNGEEYPQCACFTFKAAQKKLREAKEFWDKYEGSLTDEVIKIPNPERQPHSAEFYFELSFNKEKLERAMKNKM